MEPRALIIFPKKADKLPRRTQWLRNAARTPASVDQSWASSVAPKTFGQSSTVDHACILPRAGGLMQVSIGSFRVFGLLVVGRLLRRGAERHYSTVKLASRLKKFPFLLGGDRTRRM